MGQVSAELRATIAPGAISKNKAIKIPNVSPTGLV
jgi:hypothetical protein